MEHDEIAVDEARRLAEHERLKGRLEQSVGRQIADKAARSSAVEDAELESVAAELKRRAAAEVHETEADLQRGRSLARVAQVVDYVFFLAYSLISLEIGLAFVGARQTSGFKHFLDAATFLLLRPFRGLLPDPRFGPLQLMSSYIVALAVYALLHLALKKLLRLLVHRTGL